MKLKVDMQEHTPSIAFFGTPEIAVFVLEELKKEGIIPSLVVTNPDRRQGRGLHTAPTPVKQWAQTENIPVIQPESVQEQEGLEQLTGTQWDLFIVVAYGSIMPKWLIDLPKYGTVNVHPSLLPKLRGASPIRTAILNDLDGAGVSIMLMDEKMDHGPILVQETYTGPLREGHILDELLARKGGALLASIVPELLAGSIVPQEQDHAKATYSKKIRKEMAEIQIDPRNLPSGDDAHVILRKIYAYDQWPTAFFIHNNKRVKILRARLENERLIIESVVPEGKKEMSFETYLMSLA